MQRKDFLKLTTLSLPLMKLNAFSAITDDLLSSQKKTLMFVGHGSPMDAIVQNDFHKKWRRLGKSLAEPQAILVISAH